MPESETTRVHHAARRGGGVAARGARAAYKGVVELVRCSSAMQTPTRSAQRWIAQVHSGREAADYSLPRSIGG
jgi:hypothetical protein